MVLPLPHQSPATIILIGHNHNAALSHVQASFLSPCLVEISIKEEYFEVKMKFGKGHKGTAREQVNKNQWSGPTHNRPNKEFRVDNQFLVTKAMAFLSL